MKISDVKSEDLLEILILRHLEIHNSPAASMENESALYCMQRALAFLQMKAKGIIERGVEAKLVK